MQTDKDSSPNLALSKRRSRGNTASYLKVSFELDNCNQDGLMDLWSLDPIAYRL